MSEQPPPQSSGSAPLDKEDDWGYDLYPERRGETVPIKWWQAAFFGAGQTNTERTSCERNVYNCFQNSNIDTIIWNSARWITIFLINLWIGPLVKLMYSALKSSGWYVPLKSKWFIHQKIIIFFCQQWNRFEKAYSLWSLWCQSFWRLWPKTKSSKNLFL